MTLRKFAKTLLTIAAGSLACLSARADSALVASYGAPGFDNQLAAMYPDRLAAFALASDRLFNVTGNPLAGAGWAPLLEMPSRLRKPPTRCRSTSRARGRRPSAI
jgi:hypothetical protein